MTSIPNTTHATGGKVWTPNAEPQSLFLKKAIRHHKIFQMAMIFTIIGITIFFLFSAAIQSFQASTQSINDQLSKLADTEKAIMGKCNISSNDADAYLSIDGNYTLTRSVEFTAGSAKKSELTMATVKNGLLTMKDSTGKTLCSVKLN